MKLTVQSSSLSLCLQHGTQLNHGIIKYRCFPTWLHLQRRRIHIYRKYKEKRNMMDIPQISNASFGSSYCYKAIKQQKDYSPTFCAQSTTDEFILQPKDDHTITPQSNFERNVDVFLRFCRPHTLIGGIIGITSVSLLPVTSFGDLSPLFFTELLKAIIPVALIRLYVTTLNQVTDVEIDKVNKPHFVLVTGEYTMAQGKAIVAALALMSFILGIRFNSPSLLVGLAAYFFFGSAYSVELPLLRWKKNPFLAALAIINAEYVFPFVFFIHTQTYVLGRPLVFTRPFIFNIISITLFALSAALMKDIPDMEGDKAFGIQTFSIMHGKRKVFNICTSAILTVYGSAILMGALSSSPLNMLISVLVHIVLGFIFWTRSQSLNLDDNPAVESFYMFTWKLFYVEYLLIHFLR